MSGVVVVVVVMTMQRLIVGEVVGSHVEFAHPRVVGERDRDRGRLSAGMAAAVEELAHGAEVRSVLG